MGPTGVQVAGKKREELVAEDKGEGEIDSWIE
jgi:hypothetical protein